MNEEEFTTEQYRCEDCGESVPGPSGLVDPQVLCPACVAWASARIAML